jgi:hypothetical protein
VSTLEWRAWTISRAYIEVVLTTKTPQGAASFWVDRRGGERVKVNLRSFPVEAAAVLFNALESHGLQVEVPDEWASDRMLKQIRAAQAKLRS